MDLSSLRRRNGRYDEELVVPEVKIRLDFALCAKDGCQQAGGFPARNSFKEFCLGENGWLGIPETPNSYI